MCVYDVFCALRVECVRINYFVTETEPGDTYKKDCVSEKENEMYSVLKQKFYKKYKVASRIGNKISVFF